MAKKKVPDNWLHRRMDTVKEEKDRVRCAIDLLAKGPKFKGQSKVWDLLSTTRNYLDALEVNLRTDIENGRGEESRRIPVLTMDEASKLGSAADVPKILAGMKRTK